MVNKKQNKKEKVLEIIFQFPEKWIHLREIARRLKISPNSVKVYVNEFKKNKIIEGKKDGNMIKIRANFDNENYICKKRIYNLEKIYGSEVVDFLFKFYNPNVIVLFGSYSRGEDISTSDIDIGIITSSKKRIELNKFEKKLGRKIELSLFTRKEISKEFFNNLINGVVLRGFLANE